MSKSIVISGTGLYVPPHKISNEELVNSFNTYVDDYNHQHKQAIEKGEIAALEYSSTSFIEKASGIHNRYVVDKAGILDPKRMRPSIPAKNDDEPSLQCEMACQAIHQALDHARKTPQEVDGVIVSCANIQRAYPGIAIEIQQALGINGYGLDIVAACSSATFGMTNAYNAIASGQNRCIVVVHPEITSGHVNFRDRDSHFIFGDICAASVIETGETAKNAGFEIVGTKLLTSFSNNIRNNSGFLNHAEVGDNEANPRHFFKQNGRKVFKEVVPMVEEHILAHISSLGLTSSDIRRYWLHQANINMNELIIKKILGKEALPNDAPIILDKYANTASCGSLIAFHLHHDDFKSGELGLICSFGAGYSIGSIVVRKV
ncbi:MAG: beta-ketoacyl-ACP synthase III [Gammaproteobacteria bacterium 39-13]|nr:beta-ketoacyl-ACP synthase III [Gammaproteobacteria bacterium]OJV89037.1 MAG: beta-ketoacyl-ACP synthase III [Gammaproteobacteria bacterium 39-13]